MVNIAKDFKITHERVRQIRANVGRKLLKYYMDMEMINA